MRIVVSAILICVVAALIVNRALAPLYGRYDMADCQAAYGRAKTHQDSVRVDLHPAAGPARVKSYCGSLRATHAASAGDLPAITTAPRAP